MFLSISGLSDQAFSAFLSDCQVLSLYCLCQVIIMHTAFSTCKCKNTIVYCDFVISMPGTINCVRPTECI